LRYDRRPDRTTPIMPSAIDTELKTGTSDTASRKFVDDFYKLAILPSRSPAPLHSPSNSRRMWT
jgi:hypothetical protein